MSINSNLFTKTVFHKVQAISVSEPENSTENESELSEEICDSIEEFENFHSSTKVPALNIFGTHRQENSEEINSALWKSAQQGKVELCRDLLSNSFYGQYIADLNYRGAGNWTALHAASDAGHLEVCALLLSFKEIIEIDVLSSTNSTPLSLACSKGHLEIAHLLVKSGASIHQIDSNGNSCLHLAAHNGHELIVSWLLLQRPDLGLRNEKGLTPEEWADLKCKKILEQYKDLQDILTGNGNALRREKKKKYMVSNRNTFPIMLTCKKTRRPSVYDNPFEVFELDSLE